MLIEARTTGSGTSYGPHVPVYAFGFLPTVPFRSYYRSDLGDLAPPGPWVPGLVVAGLAIGCAAALAWAPRQAALAMAGGRRHVGVHRWVL